MQEKKNRRPPNTPAFSDSVTPPNKLHFHMILFYFDFILEIIYSNDLFKDKTYDGERENNFLYVFSLFVSPIVKQAYETIWENGKKKKDTKFESVLCGS